MKILIVDDHPLIRAALRQVLTALDEQVVILDADGKTQALDFAQNHEDIGLTLLDLTLAGSDGFEVLHELRERYPAIPVVVLSAQDQPETVRRALDEGAMGFISKTSSNAVLVNALRLVLSGGVYLPPQLLKAQSTEGISLPKEGAPIASYRDIGLTERQADVMKLLIEGKPNKLICRELNLAEGTVKIHVTAILKALGVATRTQAVIAVGRLGLNIGHLGTKTPISGGT